MFQPETEDMLPRMAPKPSAVVSLEAGDGIVRPQVPEVSILLGQQEVNVKQLPVKIDAKPTYEAWKKQMLPKVTFPPTVGCSTEVRSNENIAAQDYNMSRFNIYPFRSPNIESLTTTRSGQSGVSDVTTANNLIMYHRSLENSGEHINYPQLPSQQPVSEPFQSLHNSRDVLTICASTQTEKISDSPEFSNEVWANVATKKDVDDVRQILNEMTKEQQRILKLLEALILNPSIQILSKPQTCDAAVQIENIDSDNQPNANGIVSVPLDEDYLQVNFKNEHLKLSNKNLQTPDGKPVAQSTTYRPNSPQLQRILEKPREVSPMTINQHATSKPNAIVQKSTSDTSLAMNELALKYLPNDKLAELLKDLNMECPLETASNIQSNIPTAIVKLNENKFEKGPSDISNASYKYLKKYRLLSEDCEGNDNINNLENENQMSSYNLPQYSIRNTPANQRQTPSNKNSPYTGRLPLSPLARNSPPQSAIPSHIINLENIKQQPKFL